MADTRHRINYFVCYFFSISWILEFSLLIILLCENSRMAQLNIVIASAAEAIYHCR